MSNGAQYLPDHQAELERLLQLRAEVARRHQLSPLPPRPADLATVRRIDRATVDVQTLRIENVEDFRKLAQSLEELADLIRGVAVPAVRRANEPLRTDDFGSRSNFFGDKRLGGVDELITRARKTSTDVTQGLQSVVTSLTDTARAVTQVGREFAEVRDMSAQRLASMNRQFTTRLRGTGQGPTGGTPSV